MKTIRTRTPGAVRAALTVIQAAAVALTVAACGGQQEPAAEVTPTPTVPAIKLAQKSCGVLSSKYATLGDGGYTLTMQGQPQYSEQGMTAQEIACVLDAVGTPDSVTGRMGATRALDGMQEASWEGFAASWTFHPDDGAKIILTEDK